MTQDYQLDHLDELEAESMFVLREVAAQFERPAILFSGGKDSIVVTHLAAKAFAPARIPMPLVHIDTGHNFPETLEFRDALAERLGVQLVWEASRPPSTPDACGKRPGTGEPQPIADHYAPRHHRRRQVRRVHRWSTTRRRESPCQGTLLQPPRRFWAVGSETPAPGCGTFSTAITCPASTSGLSTKQLD